MPNTNLNFNALTETQKELIIENILYKCETSRLTFSSVASNELMFILKSNQKTLKEKFNAIHPKNRSWNIK